MIDKARKGETINVVDDMWMSPTYTRDAAETIKKIVELGLPSGTYHATNDGYCTWFQFACEIFKLLGLNPKINQIKTSQLQAKAKRPVFSALKSVKLSKHGMKMRTWREALREYLMEKKHM
jgi:dTDP-4-dehydrorhamnose reductase